ncbi:hypothetical protein MP638_003631 [Amoeboaphelidium occidentale]|nr:hypothetical protein MP638_003631 [Amoeboaphelidium occidentale]
MVTSLRLPEDLDFEFTCTTFDTHEEVTEKYPESVSILAKLHKLPFVTVHHRINAWELPVHFPSKKFDVIIWNHPHLGTEDFRLHRFLMAHFLSSASIVLAENDYSRICVSLVEGQELRWDLSGQAIKCGLKALAATPFDEHKFPGYICKRNKNGQSFKNIHTKKHMGYVMGSFVHRFVKSLDSERDEVVSADTENSVSFDTALNATIAKVRKLDLQGEEVMFDYNVYKNKDKRKGFSKLITQNTVFKCPECLKNFGSYRGAGQHYHQIHVLMQGEEEGDSNGDPLKCSHDSCSIRVFNRRKDLEQHILSKHFDIKQDSEWQKIAKDYASKEDSNGKEYAFVPCDVCGQAVSAAPGGMQVHLESLKPLIGMKMSCPLECGTKTFLEIRALEQHFRTCLVRNR